MPRSAMSGSVSRRRFVGLARNTAIFGAVAGLAILYGADAAAPVPVSRVDPEQSPSAAEGAPATSHRSPVSPL